MQEHDSMLLSKLSLLIPENDFHIQMHAHGDNSRHYRHHHDYYEINFYLGDEDSVYQCGKTVYPSIRATLFSAACLKAISWIFKKTTDMPASPSALSRRSYGVIPKRVQICTRCSLRRTPIIPLCMRIQMQLQKYLRMIEELRQLDSTPGEQIISSAIVHRILGCLYCDLHLEDSPDTASFQHIHLVGSILHYVEQNLSEKLSLKDIAEKYNYSVTYISKLFKNVTGSSLVSYIIEKRIARARQLMYEDLEITEIAERVGYHNYSNFYKAFKKAVGISPEEYRRQLNTFGK